ncbi:MAG: tRNA uridine-5-carboxymethylaminomethyl(34) synthesis GTPase MnmE [bacterium]
MYTNDTIAAISTPLGTGAIGVIRLSGPAAIATVNSVFKPRRKKSLNKVPSHTAHVGNIVSPQGEVVDEVLLVVMRAPNSYTGEDVVEISCHGGTATLEVVMSLLLSKGARHAIAGEFTRRAFLNGRVDLAQAEAVSDIINARTQHSRALAVSQLRGDLSSAITDIRNNIIDILSDIEASLDYPDEDIPSPVSATLLRATRGILSRVKALVESAASGIVMRDGLRIAIAGKPNVGKSTLLNRLLSRQRAIVTPEAGTTRDSIEEWVSIDGLPAIITDTAGIKKAVNKVEKLGVQKSREAVKNADVIMFVIDLSRPLTKNDTDVAQLLRDKKHIIVGNKSDLKKVVKNKDIANMFGGRRSAVCFVAISALTGKGVERLRGSVKDIFSDITPESVVVTNVRHAEALRRAQSSLERLEDTLKNKGFSEFLVMELRGALDSLGEITGHVSTQEVLDRIFSKFCVGK